MKENITHSVGTCNRCHEKFQPLDDSGRCESCFDDPIPPHPFQPEAAKVEAWYDKLTEND